MNPLETDGLVKRLVAGASLHWAAILVAVTAAGTLVGAVLLCLTHAANQIWPKEIA